MGCKYVKEFEFGGKGEGGKHVKGYYRGGKVQSADMKQDKAVVKSAVRKHESNMHPGKKPTKLAAGGEVSAAVMPRQPSQANPAKNPDQMSQSDSMAAMRAQAAQQPKPSPVTTSGQTPQQMAQRMAQADSNMLSLMDAYNSTGAQQPKPSPAKAPAKAPAARPGSSTRERIAAMARNNISASQGSSPLQAVRTAMGTAGGGMGSRLRSAMQARRSVPVASKEPMIAMKKGGKTGC